jgi:arginyl-tRNA--protein-N-Asp/Glu arginylyltransferase
MSDPADSRQPLHLYITPSHPCSYLPAKAARTLFVDPQAKLDGATYGTLASLGFRRSGSHVYRPRCAECRACVPVRVPVSEFRPNRAQRRTWRANQDLIVSEKPAHFDWEHFRLYRRYVGQRHAGGDMDDSDPQKYIEFLGCAWDQPAFYEFRLGQTLVAVAVADRLPKALSAVYSFFEPTQKRRSLGVFAVLWELHRAQALGLSWLYLGYWIRQSAKMRYKESYRPIEAYLDGEWKGYGLGEPLPEV